MRRFPGIVLSVCTATLVAVPHAALAEVDPDTSYGGIEFQPYNSFNFGNPFGVRPDLYYDSQPLDCDKAGTGGLFDAAELNNRFGWGDGRIGLYSRGQLDLGGIRDQRD